MNPNPSAPSTTVDDATITAKTAQGMAVALVVVLAVLSIGLIAQNADVEPIFDQKFIDYTFAEGYPALESGITSHLIVGAVNAIVPYEPQRSNALVRGVAALFYLFAGGLLAWSLTGRERLWAFLLFMLLLFTSRFPLLWLSSEVFAGALLMLVLWSLVRNHPFVVTAALLVLFSFAKPDLLVPGAALGLFLTLRRDVLSRGHRFAIFAALGSLVLVPGVVDAGLGYLQSGGRSMISFGQHYAALVQPHQIAEAPDPWLNYQAYLQNQFFRAGDSIGGVIRTRPDLYMDFVFLSLAESIRRMGPSYLLLLLPLAAYCFSALKRTWKTVTLLVLTNLVPILLLSFLHVRYQARFYPLVLFVIVGSLACASSTKNRERLVAVCLAGLFLLQLFGSMFFFKTGHWFPD